MPRRVNILLLVVFGLSAVLLASGCQSAGGNSKRLQGPHSTTGRIRRVACLYELKPWLNLDQAGDLDPEGIHYHVFLDPGTGSGVLRDGTFHIEMYKMGRTPTGERERTLVSDWHYPTSTFPTVGGKLLGHGYHIRLVWATKELAGHEVELVTRYEDPSGNTVGSGTKRLRIPKHTS